MTTPDTPCSQTSLKHRCIWWSTPRCCMAIVVCKSFDIMRSSDSSTQNHVCRSYVCAVNVCVDHMCATPTLYPIMSSTLLDIQQLIQWGDAIDCASRKRGRARHHSTAGGKSFLKRPIDNLPAEGTPGCSSPNLSQTDQKNKQPKHLWAEICKIIHRHVR